MKMMMGHFFIKLFVIVLPTCSASIFGAFSGIGGAAKGIAHGFDGIESGGIARGIESGGITPGIGQGGELGGITPGIGQGGELGGITPGIEPGRHETPGQNYDDPGAVADKDEDKPSRPKTPPPPPDTSTSSDTTPESTLPDTSTISDVTSTISDVSSSPSSSFQLPFFILSIILAKWFV